MADGRSNRPDVGRHSLGSKDPAKALQNLEELDRVKAVEFGVAEASVLNQMNSRAIGLSEGWDLYRNHLARPEVARGASAKTRQRYAAIADKFLDYAKKYGIRFWRDMTDELLGRYVQHLQRKGYAERTQYMEGTLVKQIVKWLAEEGLIPRDRQLKLRLRKVQGTQTHCWAKTEVAAMLEHCREAPDLCWLADVIVALANTGLRISELAALRWSDVNLELGMIAVSNDASGSVANPERRRTKNRLDRSIPIHDDLRAALETIHRSADGLVFHGPLGGKLKPDTVRNIFIRRVIIPLKERFPNPPGQIGFESGRLHTASATTSAAQPLSRVCQRRR